MIVYVGSPNWFTQANSVNPWILVNLIQICNGMLCANQLPWSGLFYIVHVFVSYRYLSRPIERIATTSWHQPPKEGNFQKSLRKITSVFMTNNTNCSQNFALFANVSIFSILTWWYVMLLYIVSHSMSWNNIGSCWHCLL